MQYWNKLILYYSCDCQNSGICDPKTGRCDCPHGWIGDHCQIPCSHLKRYGKNCRHICQHPPNSTCDPVTGHYYCNPGLRGQFCDKPCAAMTYGQDCLQKCDCHVAKTITCERVSGKCVCKEGYHGDR